MINFKFRPSSYFDGTGPTSLIAKLTYPESQWGEALTLYATPIDGEIHFEMVDFYGNDYILKPAKSKTPLTLEEIIVLIETLEVPEDGMQGRANLTLAGIPEAESWVYPELKDYFLQKRKTFGMN
jgi:hypothetical protein